MSNKCTEFKKIQYFQVQQSENITHKMKAVTQITNTSKFHFSTSTTFRS